MQAVNDVKDREESATPSPPRPTRQVLSCDTKDLQFLALTRPCLYDQTLSSSFSSHTLTLSRTHYLTHTCTVSPTYTHAHRLYTTRLRVFTVLVSRLCVHVGLGGEGEMVTSTCRTIYQPLATFADSLLLVCVYTGCQDNRADKILVIPLTKLC